MGHRVRPSAASLFEVFMALSTGLVCLLYLFIYINLNIILKNLKIRLSIFLCYSEELKILVNTSICNDVAHGRWCWCRHSPALLRHGGATATPATGRPGPTPPPYVSLAAG
jgi:hypothetical protein